MQVTSALVVYAVLWFLVLFVILPLRNVSQGEAGKVLKGTTASAPSDPQMKRRFLLTSVIAFVIWVPLCAAIIYGYITVDMFNLYAIIGPDS